jgi:hypothetical protein
MSTKTFQVGTLAQPLEVLFGPAHFDEGQKARMIKVFVDDEKTVQELRDIDPELVTDDQNTGRQSLRLKMWQNAKIKDNKTKKLIKVDDLHRGDRIVVMVKSYNWEYEGREGVSLTSGEALLLERGSKNTASTTNWQ